MIGRGVVAIGAAHYKSYVGVCLASPAAWVLAGGLLLVMYFCIMKKYPRDFASAGMSCGISCVCMIDKYEKTSET